MQLRDIVCLLPSGFLHVYPAPPAVLSPIAGGWRTRRGNRKVRHAELSTDVNVPDHVGLARLDCLNWVVIWRRCGMRTVLGYRRKNQKMQ
jgi:hypothetical protein